MLFNLRWGKRSVCLAVDRRLNSNSMMISDLEIELVLLRHGSTRWNAERRYLGYTDMPLLPGSLEQLKGLAEQPNLHEDFWRVYSSDLIRCKETLACVVPKWKDTAVYDKRLREMNFGDWEGLTYEDLKENRTYRDWLDDPGAVTPPNGESWEQFEGRVNSFLLTLTQAVELDFTARRDKGEEDPGPKRILIVTHGGVIRLLLASAQPGLSFQEIVSPPPGMTSVLRLGWRYGQWNR